MERTFPAMGMLVNGGAALALLTSLALPADQKRAVAATLVWFAWGLSPQSGRSAFSLHQLFHGGEGRSKQRIMNTPICTIKQLPSGEAWRTASPHPYLLAGLTSFALSIVQMLCVRAALTKL